MRSLRILDDELFHAVQARLAEFKHGPRGPHKQKKQLHLWDLTTEFFYCVHCKVRSYQTGANGKGMQCKRGDLCPCKSAVRREEAVLCDLQEARRADSAGFGASASDHLQQPRNRCPRR